MSEPMRICIISTAAIPTPPPSGYAGLEVVIGNLAIELARRGNHVTLFSARGSKNAGRFDVESSDGSTKGELDVIETVEPGWVGWGELEAFKETNDYIGKTFGDGQSVVLDSTWTGLSYFLEPGFVGTFQTEKGPVDLDVSSYPDIKLVNVHHGMPNWSTPPPGVKHPRQLGVSTVHAQYLSSVIKWPVRHVWNGIHTPDELGDTSFGIPDYFEGQPYILSLNRITDEKGIHDAIDVAVQNKTNIIVAGDDTKVRSKEYVSQIADMCRNSKYALYMGLVDDYTKTDLIRHCSATIACPINEGPRQWVEAFGLFAVEGMAYGKPALALANGGLMDIVKHGETGFLGTNPQDLAKYVPKIGEIDPQNCIKRVEENFTVSKMTDGYEKIFRGILAGDESFNW